MAVQKPQKADSVLLSILKKPVWLLSWLAASLLVSILIEWTGLLVWWREEGAMHSETILRQEMGYLASSFGGQIMHLPTPAEIGIPLMNQLYYALFEWTGIHDFLISISAAEFVGEASLATLNTVQVFVVRLTLIVLSLPLFLLAFVWGFGEGLIRRELRKYGGDIERGFWYHHLKKWSAAVFVLPLIVYLTLPIAMNPAYLFLPFAATFALLIMGTSALFIKNA